VTRAARPAEAPKRAPGRPAEGPGGETRDAVLTLRLTAAEREEWATLAEARGVTVGQLVRETMAARVRRG
jgi:hypothetical protein